MKGVTFNAYHNLGEIYSQEEKWQAAISSYKKAIKLNPKFFWSHHSLGKACANIKQWEKAIYSYKEALQLNPQDPVTYHCLGDAFAKQKELEATFNPIIKKLNIYMCSFV